MVRYQGGKHRIGKEIATVMQKIEREMGYSCLPYAEFFCGANGVMRWMGKDLLSSSSRHSETRSKSYDDSKRSRTRSSSHGSRSYTRSSRDSRSRRYESSKSKSSRNSSRRGRCSLPSSFKSHSRSSSRSRSRSGGCRRLRFASDANGDMIAMWKALQKGWKPPTHCTQRTWDRAKASRGPTAERGFIGAFCSFGGQFFSGFAGKYDSKTDYAKQAAKSLEKFRGDVKDVKFWHGSFFKLPHNPVGLCMYLDPPEVYAQSKKAKPNKLFAEFDTERFWDDVRRLSRNNLVFISEEVAPSDFICVWQVDYRRGAPNQRKNTKKYTDKGEKAPVKLSVEKLYMFRIPPSSSAFKRKPVLPF